MLGWWRGRSLRFRLAAIAGFILGVGLTGAAVAVVGLVGGNLTRGLDLATGRRAHEVAASFDLTQLNAPVPRVLPDPGDGVIVQVLTPTGRVVAGTPEGLARPPLPTRPGAHTSDDPGNPLPLRSVTVELPGGVVVAATSYRSVADGVHALVLTLVLGVPLLAGLGTAASWALVGGALRPVEQLRLAAAAIVPGAGARLPLPAARDEVGRLAETLNAMLVRQESAAARQRRFVADAAHELRSPLTSARTTLEVGLRLDDAAEWPGVASDVLAEILRLARLVEDLLVLARADETAPAARLHRLDLRDLADQAADRAGGGRVAVSVVRSGRALPVQADPDAMARVIRNLVDNAMRHAHSRVVLEPRLRGEVAELLVRDDGPGVAAADAERIFARFARLDDARSRDAGGTGLGLPIARELARAAGGDVALAGGQGSTFLLRLPRCGPR